MVVVSQEVGVSALHESGGTRGQEGWPKDYFARCEKQQFWFGGGFFLLLALIVVAVLGVFSCFKGTPQKHLVLYTSQDQQFAEPILNEFSKQTGIKVSAVFDSEAVKTVGLANRLLAETNHPRCDVWWSNEALRTRQLARRGALEPESIVEFGFRSRRVVINTNKLSLANAPKSLLEITNAEWRGKVALAYPMFGTTSAQFIALRRSWGAERWEQWCRALAANKPFLVDGNSQVVKLVGRGEALIGLTDFDDIAAGQREGLPIAALPLNDESRLIPNSVALVRGGPHSIEAKRLREFLISETVLQQLIAASALEGKSTASANHLAADWSTMLDDMESAAAFLTAVFLRQ
jgi:iron(III) transport system substrate-binding protein